MTCSASLSRLSRSCIRPASEHFKSIGPYDYAPIENATLNVFERSAPYTPDMTKRPLNLIKTILPLGTIFTGYALLGWGLILNRLNPSYETALGTAYFAFFGLVVTSVGVLLALVFYRAKRTFRRHLIFSIVAFAVYLFIFMLANNGKLAVL